MDKHEIDNIRLGESNNEDYILIERNEYEPEYGHKTPPRWVSASFVHWEQVRDLRDWLNAWLDEHVFTVKPVSQEAKKSDVRPKVETIECPLCGGYHDRT